MSSLPQRFSQFLGKSKRTMMFVTLAMLAFVAFGVHGFAQQEQERLLERQVHPKEPMRIKAIKGKKGEVLVSKKFLDDDDWLRALTFRLENISDKNIVFVRLAMEFPRSDDDPPFFFTLQYGAGLLPNDPPVAPISPGEDVLLSFSVEEYNALQYHLGDLKYPKSIKRVIFDIEKVIFDDGIMWQMGGLFRRDPNNPRHWRSIQNFPGIGFTPNAIPDGGKSLSHRAKSSYVELRLS